MKVITLDDASRDAFVNERRLGILCTLRRTGGPFAVPIWYRWTGTEVELFSERDAPKVDRVTADPRVTLLVANNPDESARWVSFEGDATIDDDGFGAAARLLERYHGSLDKSGNQATLKHFEGSDLVRIAIKPDKVITYAETFE